MNHEPTSVTKVKVWYKDANKPLTYSATMTYVKDVFFCLIEAGVTYKHPIANIWRVTEEELCARRAKRQTSRKT